MPEPDDELPPLPQPDAIHSIRIMHARCAIVAMAPPHTECGSTSTISARVNCALISNTRLLRNDLIRARQRRSPAAICEMTIRCTAIAFFNLRKLMDAGLLLIPNGREVPSREISGKNTAVRQWKAGYRTRSAPTTTADCSGRVDSVEECWRRTAAARQLALCVSHGARFWGL